MNDAMRSLVKSGVGTIYDSLSEKEGLKKIGERLASRIMRTPFLNGRDRARLWDAFMKIARRGVGHGGDDLRKILMSHQVYDPLIQAVNEIERKSEARAKASILASEMHASRAQDLPRIFYLGSYHQKPAEGHKDYQGKIYVDRMWRSLLKEHNLEGLIPLVEKYIEANSILAVQRVIRAPVWFTTRPYCKHYFTPLETQEVLGTSLDEVKENHPEARVGERRSLTDAERYARYRDLRDAILESMKEKTTV